MATYEIRLMFEWGGGCLWGMNEAAKEKFGYAELELCLPLSDNTKAALAELSALHDKALNWADPTGPSPWTHDDFTEFEDQVQSLLQDLQIELGGSYFVWYQSIGSASSQ